MCNRCICYTCVIHIKCQIQNAAHFAMLTDEGKVDFKLCTSLLTWPTLAKICGDWVLGWVRVKETAGTQLSTAYLSSINLIYFDIRSTLLHVVR